MKDLLSKIYDYVLHFLQKDELILCIMDDKCVVLNVNKMNFDGKLDFSILSSDVTVQDDTTEQQLIECIQGADIIVTKEMPVNADMIQSISRICQTYL